MAVSYDEVLKDLEGLGELAEFAEWLESQSFLASPRGAIDLMQHPESYRPHYEIMLAWHAAESVEHQEMLVDALIDKEPSPDRLHWNEFAVFKTESSGRPVWKYEHVTGEGPHGFAATPEACVVAIEKIECEQLLA